MIRRAGVRRRKRRVPTTVQAAEARVLLSGTSLALDGDDSVNFVKESLDVGTSSRTISAWFKTDNAGATQTIINNGWTKGSYQQHYLGLQNGKLYFNVNLDGTDHEIIGQTNVTNDWHHVVLTIDRDNAQARLYLDGESDGTTSISDINADTWTHSWGLLGIGTQGSSNRQFFDGLLDDLRVYDLKTSDGSIDGLSANNLIAHWKFDTDSGLFTDSAGSLTPHGYFGDPTSSDVTAPISDPPNNDPPNDDGPSTGDGYYEFTSGSNSGYLEVAGSANSALDLTSEDEFTIEVTFEADAHAYAASNGHPTEVLVNKEDAYMIMIRDNTFQWAVRGANQSWSAINTGIAPVAGSKTHVALVYKRGLGVKFYVNGQAVNGGNWHSATTATINNSTQKNLRFGARYYTDFNQKFTGKIYEVRIWRKALAASDIDASFSHSDPDLIEAFLLDEATGTTTEGVKGLFDANVIGTANHVPGEPTDPDDPPNDDGPSTGDGYYEFTSGSNSGYLEVAGSANSALDLTAEDEFTIEVTFEADTHAYAASNGHPTEVLVNKEDAYMIMIRDNTFQWAVRGANQSWSAINTGIAPVAGSKTHVALVYKRGLGVKFYVNGQAANNGNWHSATTATINNSTQKNLRFGARYYTDYNQKFTGKIYEVRIWRKAVEDWETDFVDINATDLIEAFFLDETKNAGMSTEGVNGFVANAIEDAIHIVALPASPPPPSTGNAIHRARAAARRIQHLNNLRDIGEALLTFADGDVGYDPDTHAWGARLPKNSAPLPEVVFDSSTPDGAEYSWRVHILPYVGHQTTYDRIVAIEKTRDSSGQLSTAKKDELAALMPSVYEDLNNKGVIEVGHTNVFGVVGEYGSFETNIENPSSDELAEYRSRFGHGLGMIVDGLTSQILAVMGAPSMATLWYEPDEVVNIDETWEGAFYDEDGNEVTIDTLGTWHLAVYADGTSKVQASGLPKHVLETHLNRDDGGLQARRDAVAAQLADGWTDAQKATWRRGFFDGLWDSLKGSFESLRVVNDVLTFPSQIAWSFLQHAFTESVVTLQQIVQIRSWQDVRNVINNTTERIANDWTSTHEATLRAAGEAEAAIQGFAVALRRLAKMMSVYMELLLAFSDHVLATSLRTIFSPFYSTFHPGPNSVQIAASYATMVNGLSVDGLTLLENGLTEESIYNGGYIAGVIAYEVAENAATAGGAKVLTGPKLLAKMKALDKTAMLPPAALRRWAPRTPAQRLAGLTATGKSSLLRYSLIKNGVVAFLDSRAHHLIPSQFYTHSSDLRQLLIKAVNNGWDLNGATNGKFLHKSVHKNHARYNDYMIRQAEAWLQRKGGIGSVSNSDAQKYLEGAARRMSDYVDENPGVNINTLFDRL